MVGTVQAEMASASARLPERQREALGLREARQLSYEEIAATMGTSRDAVAQLIAHAWINLYDELEGTILASVAPSPECERALRLIAARDDEELDADSVDASWLDDHLEHCGRCRRGVEEMREARARYRSRGAAPAARQRRPVAVLAAAAALLLLAGVAAAFVRDGPNPTAVDQAADAAQRPNATTSRRGGDGSAEKGEQRKKGDRDAGGAEPDEPQTAQTPTATPPPASAPTGGPTSSPTSRPAGPGGNAGIEPTQRTSSPSPRPKPPSTTTSTTSPLAPSTPEPAPVAESDDGPPYGREPPGKAVGRPSH